jgi:hypothetical protein
LFNERIAYWPTYVGRLSKKAKRLVEAWKPSFFAVNPRPSTTNVPSPTTWTMRFSLRTAAEIDKSKT